MYFMKSKYLHSICDENLLFKLRCSINYNQRPSTKKKMQNISLIVFTTIIYRNDNLLNIFC